MPTTDLTIINNQQLIGAAGRPFLLDLYYQPDAQPKPILLFVHGYKGFKDWGHWQQIGRYFAERGYVFIKFNFSHNGTTITSPDTFDDLEAFGNNNYQHELADIDALLTCLHKGSTDLPAREADLSRIGLIGHSRGGAISIIKAANDARVKALATWAAVSRLDYAWSKERVAQWEKEGVYYIVNGRTGQNMPMYYQMYQNFIANRTLLNVQSALDGFNKPMLILHGTADPAVPHTAAETLQRDYSAAQLHLIEGADHVFGGQHPYESNELPAHSEELVEVSRQFFDEQL
jgi:dienelactone hydrolase